MEQKGERQPRPEFYLFKISRLALSLRIARGACLAYLADTSSAKK